MKLNRIFLSLVASLFTLFSSGQVAAQGPGGSKTRRTDDSADHGNGGI